MEFVVDGTHPWQLSRSCDFTAQSLAGLIHNWLLLLVVDINTKSHDGCCRLRLFGVGGDASQKTSFSPYRRHHPQRHALHDDNSRHGSKSPPLAVKKQ